MSALEKKEATSDAGRVRRAEVLMAIVWVAIIVFCLVNRNEFTLEEILNYTPRQPVLAVLLLLVLFAVKSLSIFLYTEMTKGVEAYVEAVKTGGYPSVEESY